MPKTNAVDGLIPVFFLCKNISSSASSAAPAITSAKVPIPLLLRYRGSKIDHAVDLPAAVGFINPLLSHEQPGRSAAIQVIGDLAVWIGFDDKIGQFRTVDPVACLGTVRRKDRVLQRPQLADRRPGSRKDHLMGAVLAFNLLYLAVNDQRGPKGERIHHRPALAFHPGRISLHVRGRSFLDYMEIRRKVNRDTDIIKSVIEVLELTHLEEEDQTPKAQEIQNDYYSDPVTEPYYNDSPVDQVPADEIGTINDNSYYSYND